MKPLISAKFLIAFTKACLKPNSWVPPSGVGTVLQKDSIKLVSFSANHLIAHSIVSFSMVTLSSNIEVVNIGMSDVLKLIYSLRPFK